MWIIQRTGSDPIHGHYFTTLFVGDNMVEIDGPNTIIKPPNEEVFKNWRVALYKQF